jgi:O-antigen/teichoic acid export membrane protein
VTSKWQKILPYLDQLLVSGGSFLTIAICAHKLSLVEQGKLGYVLALYMVTIVMQGSLIHNWASVKFPKRKKPQRYFQSLVLMCVVLALVSTLVLCVALYFLASGADWLVSYKVLGLLCIYLLLQQAADFLRKAAYYSHQQERALWVSVMMYPARIVLLSLIAVNSIDDVLVISLVTCVFPLLWFVRLPKRDHRHSFPHLMRIGLWHLRGSSQLGVMAVITWAWNYIPVFFLGALQGTAAVALLVSLRSLSNLFNVVLEVLETSFASKFAKAYAATVGWREIIRKEYLTGLGLWLAGFLVLLAMHDVLVPIALGNNFVGYDYLILLFWVAQGFTYLFRIDGIKFRTMGVPKLITLGSFCALIFVVSSGSFVISRYGVNGATFLYILAPLVVYASQIFAFKWMSRGIRLS